MLAGRHAARCRDMDLGKIWLTDLLPQRPRAPQRGQLGPGDLGGPELSSANSIFPTKFEAGFLGTRRSPRFGCPRGFLKDVLGKPFLLRVMGTYK